MQPAVSQDSDELQALFDSIAQQAQNTSPPAPPDGQQTAPCAPQPGQADVTTVVHRIGQLTRMLHDNLRELGYDKMIAQAAAAIPDARNRLSYVATMTEQAATRALNATEAARPIQEKLSEEARHLAEQWGKMHARELTFEQFKAMIEDTRRYLSEVPQRTEATNAQLTEIMMAQDFQDLTGQVIKKVTEMVQGLERELLQLLLDSIPPEKRVEPAAGLLNGPVVSAAPDHDVVTNQNQVDELLESLGF